MALSDLFRRKAPAATPASETYPRADAVLFESINDPALIDFLRSGSETASGSYVSASTALRNTAVFRCVDLISSTIGMLPLHLIRKGENSGEIVHQTQHPLYNLLMLKPNKWQTAFQFRSQLQMSALLNGDGYARIVRSRGNVIALVPLEWRRVTARQTAEWTMQYTYTPFSGGTVEIAQEDLFHLRGLSEDGLNGISRVKMAQEAIGLALAAERAAARLFKNGTMVGGAMTHPGKLNDEAFKRLRESFDERFSGSENANKWMILEEGLKAEPFSQTARDAQHAEARKMQIEEVARVFGVPRPLLMMDDTSWGSGIEQLGMYFVQFALASWFQAWEQAIACSLLTEAEMLQGYRADFDEQQLLRGSMKDQAEFYAKALGAGGSQGWLVANEAREATGYGPHPDGDKLPSPARAAPSPAPEKTNAK
ncbi:phage portal protein [Labrys portucalensis]|uniref:Phage portal protein n=1 Tax=Labrys neptuniae TaxID=376174 RepID=A0ABV6Z8N4_9HYPH